jgi:hypothetical protein
MTVIDSAPVLVPLVETKSSPNKKRKTDIPRSTLLTREEPSVQYLRPPTPGPSRQSSSARQDTEVGFAGHFDDSPAAFLENLPYPRTSADRSKPKESDDNDFFLKILDTASH